MQDRRCTKIVATLGPATESDGAIQELLESGVDVFRLNFSHGSHEIHQRRIEAIRRVSAKTGINVAILQDIQGPKIRVGEFAGGEAKLEPGHRFVLTSREIEGNGDIAHISYETLGDDVPVGTHIMLDDGLLELVVTGREGEDLVTEVVVGGTLRPHKGVNFPGVTLKVSVLTEKDREDLAFGMQIQVDMVAASFIQQASDILEIKDFMSGLGRVVPIIAKIETQSAVQKLQDIIGVCDGVMVARGDLGVEMPTEEVPMIQKRIIHLANLAGKPVITATQMLDSMVNSPRPTRAEASDVANAILDGTDAIMLSNETAMGAYPALAVQTMVRIAKQTEKFLPLRVRDADFDNPYARPIQDGISHAATHMVPELNAAAIITITSTGSSARLVSKYRPKVPIIAVSAYPEVVRQMKLVWGVIPLLFPENRAVDQRTQSAVQTAMESGIIKSGDLVIIVSGIPAGVPGSTNMVKVEVVAAILARGIGLGKRTVSAVARIFADPETANRELQPGQILVTETTDASWVPAMQKAGGIVVRTSGLSSQTALVGLEFGVPVILGVDHLDSINDGEVVTIEPSRGLVYKGQVNI